MSIFSLVIKPLETRLETTERARVRLSEHPARSPSLDGRRYHVQFLAIINYAAKNPRGHTPLLMS